MSFIRTQKRGDEKDGERKGMELGGTCEREEIKANKGKNEGKGGFHYPNK